MFNQMAESMSVAQIAETIKAASPEDVTIEHLDIADGAQRGSDPGRGPHAQDPVAPVGSFPPGGTVRKSVAGRSLAGADDGDRDGTGAGGRGAEQPARASAAVISSAPAETRERPRFRPTAFRRPPIQLMTARRRFYWRNSCGVPGGGRVAPITFGAATTPLRAAELLDDPGIGARLVVPRQLLPDLGLACLPEPPAPLRAGQESIDGPARASVSPGSTSMAPLPERARVSRRSTVLMRCQVIRLFARNDHALSSEALYLEIVVPLQDRSTSAATGRADASAIKTGPSPVRMMDSQSMRKKRRGWTGPRAPI